MPQRLDSRDAGFAAAFDALVEAGREADVAVSDVVAAIIEDPRIKAVTLTGSEPAGRAVASTAAAQDDPRGWSHVRVATKYPHVTAAHFAARGVQAECVKLNGAMELAPTLGLAPRIVDLVSSGKTLKENGLVEVEVIAEVTSRLIVNRAAFKTRAEIVPLVEAFRRAVSSPLPLAGGAGGGPVTMEAAT